MSKQANAEPNPKSGLRLNFPIKTQRDGHDNKDM